MSREKRFLGNEGNKEIDRSKSKQLERDRHLHGWRYVIVIVQYVSIILEEASKIPRITWRTHNRNKHFCLIIIILSTIILYLFSLKELWVVCESIRERNYG